MTWREHAEGKGQLGCLKGWFWDTSPGPWDGRWPWMGRLRGYTSLLPLNPRRCARKEKRIPATVRCPIRDSTRQAIRVSVHTANFPGIFNKAALCKSVTFPEKLPPALATFISFSRFRDLRICKVKPIFHRKPNLFLSPSLWFNQNSQQSLRESILKSNLG